MAISIQTELDQIRSLEDLKSLEFKAQFVLVGFAVAVVWFAMSLSIFIAWFVFHYFVVILEKVLLKRNFKPTWQFYALILGLNALIGFTFSALPVYLWSHDQDVYQLAAMAMLVGATLNTALVRSRNWQVMVCYMVPNGLAFVGVAYLIFLREGYGVETVVSIVLSAVIFAYFAVSVKEAYQSHKIHACVLEQLAHTQKAEAVGTLAGGIAHDFNNLLNVISGNLELMRDDPVDPQNSELITQSLRAVERGANITAQLLALGGKSHLQPKHVDLSIAFIELEHMLNRLLPKSCEVRVHTDPDLPLVDVDEAALQTALINLAINARDAMLPSGVLSIKATTTQENGNKTIGANDEMCAPSRVLISVHDNGAGIPADIASKVTEPFFTTKEIGKGVGLGLAMVQGFVEQSSGILSISSRPSEGTLVSISLPAIAAIDKIIPPQLTPVDQISIGTRVLVVEDEAQLRKLICQRLRNDGFEVKEAYDGEHALEKIKAGFKPDVLLTDIVMPGPIQGNQLIDELRRLHPGTPTIAMSGYAKVDGDSTSVGPLGDVFLQKPVPLYAISAAIQKFAVPNATR